MDWISVKDRLPELNSKVLAYRTYYGGATEMMVLDYTIIDGEKLFGFFDGEYGDEVIARFVTHWMPLPEPPASD